MNQSPTCPRCALEGQHDSAGACIQALQGALVTTQATTARRMEAIERQLTVQGWVSGGRTDWSDGATGPGTDAALQWLAGCKTAEDVLRLARSQHPRPFSRFVIRNAPARCVDREFVTWALETDWQDLFKRADFSPTRFHQEIASVAGRIALDVVTRPDGEVLDASDVATRTLGTVLSNAQALEDRVLNEIEGVLARSYFNPAKEAQERGDEIVRQKDPNIPSVTIAQGEIARAMAGFPGLTAEWVGVIAERMKSGRGGIGSMGDMGVKRILGALLDSPNLNGENVVTAVRDGAQPWGGAISKTVAKHPKGRRSHALRKFFHEAENEDHRFGMDHYFLAIARDQADFDQMFQKLVFADPEYTMKLIGEEGDDMPFLNGGHIATILSIKSYRVRSEIHHIGRFLRLAPRNVILDLVGNAETTVREFGITVSRLIHETRKSEEPESTPAAMDASIETARPRKGMSR